MRHSVIKVIIINFWFFVCGFHITLVGTHVPKYVIDRGLGDWTAAMILSLIGLFNIFGSLMSGYLSAKMSKKIILSVIYFLRGISIIAFIFLPPSNISSIIFGASFWTFVAINCSSHQRNGCTYIWNKIFRSTLWFSFFKPPNWFLLWGIFRRFIL